MQQIKILTARRVDDLEKKINSFLNEIDFKHWKMISMTHATHYETFFVYSEYETRILYEKPNGTD